MFIKELLKILIYGDMIKTVSFEKTVYGDLPLNFEAGTPDYVAAIGLAAAIDYVNAIGFDEIMAYETELYKYADAQLSAIEGIRFFGRAKERASLFSFLVNDIHSFDMGTLLDKLGVAVRTGHHCAQPLMQHLGIEGTVRASFAFYNTKEEIDALAAGIVRVAGMF